MRSVPLFITAALLFLLATYMTLNRAVELDTLSATVLGAGLALYVAWEFACFRRFKSSLREKPQRIWLYLIIAVSPPMLVGFGLLLSEPLGRTLSLSGGQAVALLSIPAGALTLAGQLVRRRIFGPLRRRGD